VLAFDGANMTQINAGSNLDIAMAVVELGSTLSR
jgi:hypothetical protein